MARIDPEKKAKAAWLLALGWSAEDIGPQLGCAARTVRTWKREPAFKELMQQHLDGLYARGLLALAQRRRTLPARLRSKLGAEAMKALNDAVTEIGRKEVRGGGR